MKTARFFGPRDIRIIETETPSVGDDEVLLKAVSAEYAEAIAVSI